MVDINRRDLLRLAGVGAAGGLLWRGLPDRPTVQTGDLTVADEATEKRTAELGEFTVRWRERRDGHRLAVEHGGDVRWQTWPGENFLEAVDGGLDVRKPRGPHVVNEQLDVVRPDQRVDSLPVGYVVGVGWGGEGSGERIGDTLAGTRVARTDSWG